MANKTWGEIREETINIGFEKLKIYEKNKSAFIAAYNEAQALIASTVDALIETITIEKEEKTTKIYDLKSLATEQGYEYVGLADLGIVDENNESLKGFDYQGNRFLIIPARCTGTYTVYVRRLPARIDSTSEDNVEVELSEKWVNLMPYLMANRLFLDDDASIAGYYWNKYDDLKNQLLAGQYVISVQVVGGIDIDRWCL